MSEPVCACGQPLATHGRTCPPKPTSGHQAVPPVIPEPFPSEMFEGINWRDAWDAVRQARVNRVMEVWEAEMQARPATDPLAAAGHTEQTTRQTHHQAVQHRNQLIRQAIQNGRTLREVGEAVGLSHVAVRNIAEKDKP